MLIVPPFPIVFRSTMSYACSSICSSIQLLTDVCFWGLPPPFEVTEFSVTWDSVTAVLLLHWKIVYYWEWHGKGGVESLFWLPVILCSGFVWREGDTSEFETVSPREFELQRIIVALIKLSSWHLKKTEQNLLCWYQSFLAPLLPPWRSCVLSSGWTVGLHVRLPETGWRLTAALGRENLFPGGLPSRRKWHKEIRVFLNKPVSSQWLVFK